jgi:hypothetical protein
VLCVGVGRSGQPGSTRQRPRRPDLRQRYRRCPHGKTLQRLQKTLRNPLVAVRDDQGPASAMAFSLVSGGLGLFAQRPFAQPHPWVRAEGYPFGIFRRRNRSGLSVAAGFSVLFTPVGTVGWARTTDLLFHRQKSASPTTTPLCARLRIIL